MLLSLIEYFDVSDTDISGTIPTEVGLLTSLSKYCLIVKYIESY
jgi:hypothetical protein